MDMPGIDALEELDRVNCAKVPQTDMILALAADLYLWHSADEESYADIRIDGRRETHALRSRGMRGYLTKRYFEKHRSAPRPESMRAALDVLEARAHYDAPQHPVALRVGEHDGAIYVDLGDPTWRAVKVTPEGWVVV